MNEPPSTPPLTGVAAAVAALDKKGTKAELGRRTGNSAMVVNNWGNDIPLKQLMNVHRATKVPVFTLKPDLREVLLKKGAPPEILREPRGKRVRRKRKVATVAE